MHQKRPGLLHGALCACVRSSAVENTRKRCALHCACLVSSAISRRSGAYEIEKAVFHAMQLRVLRRDEAQTKQNAGRPLHLKGASPQQQTRARCIFLEKV